MDRDAELPDVGGAGGGKTNERGREGDAEAHDASVEREGNAQGLLVVANGEEERQLDGTEREEESRRENIRRNPVHGRAKYVTGSNLSTLLKRFPWTEHLLKLSKLHSKSRILLTKTIVDYMVEKHRFNVKKAHFLFWTTEIVAVFPCESRKVYYNPPGAGAPVATGKLWDRYNNLKRCIRRCKVQAPVQPLQREQHPQTSAQLINHMHGVSLDDYRQLEDLWRRTFTIRDRGESIASYYQLFPQLSTPFGSTLLAIDYELMQVSALDAFKQKWPVLSQKIYVLASKRKSLKPLFNHTDEVAKEILSFKLLPYMFRPKPVSGAKKWKPSQSEQAGGFVKWINAMPQLDEAITEYETLMAEHNLPCQPVVYAVGPIHALQAVYVIINRVKYSFVDLPSAVDFCFKAYFALNARYPPECEQVWAFLERYVYEVNAPKINQEFISVSSFISDLASVDN